MLHSVLDDGKPAAEGGRSDSCAEHLAAEGNVCEIATGDQRLFGHPQPQGSAGEHFEEFRDAHRRRLYMQRIDE